MKYPIIFLLLGLFVPINASNQIEPSSNDPHDQCRQFLHNLTKTNTPAINRTIEENNTLTFSGHNMNDLGDYHTCNKFSTQKYNLFTASNGFLGFCGPSFCTTSQLQNYSNELLHNISVLTRKDLSKYKVRVIDPQDTGIEKGFSLYLAVLAIGAVGILTVVGTISANSAPKKTGLGPNSVVEPNQEAHEGLREALMANKETVNEVFSKDTANAYFNQKKDSFHGKKAAKKSTFKKLAECFDLKKNIHDLVNLKVDPSHDPNLNVFNGVRAMGYAYVVLGHVMGTFSVAKNYSYLQMFFKSKWLLFFIGGFYAVDTFFYLSGFFTGFLLLSKLKKMPFGLSNYFKLVFHRLIRLWPAYLVAIFLYWKIAVYYGDGVVWYSYVEQAQMCTKSAWQNLFFMNNFIGDKDVNSCFGWGWYLACDFQMFLAAPFICWIYLKKKSRGQIVIWFLIVLSLVASYYETLNTGTTYILAPTMANDGKADFFIDYYINTIVRFSPYLLGLLLGLKFREYKNGQKNFFNDIKKGKINSSFLALAGFVLIIFIIFYPRTLQNGGKWTNGFATTWSAFTRPIFGFAIFLLTVACLVGNLPRLRDFMSNAYFTLISRLSYTSYLVHYIVMMMVVYDVTRLPGFTEWYGLGVSFAICILSVFVAAILHLFVEKPFVNIETKFFHQTQQSVGQIKTEK